MIPGKKSKNYYKVNAAQDYTVSGHFSFSIALLTFILKKKYKHSPRTEMFVHIPNIPVPNTKSDPNWEKRNTNIALLFYQ